MTSILHDARHSLRQLARNPGFTAAAVLTLALGIGANTAIFSVVNGLLLRPPEHIAQFDRLVSIHTSDFSGPAYGSSSYPDVRDFAAGTPALSGVAAYTVAPVVMSDATGRALSELVLATVVTGNYFDLLGVPMASGRSFAPAEGEPGGDHVVILGHSFWQTRLGGDAGIVGRSLRLAGQPFTVIGIAPPRFDGLLPGISPAFYVTAGAGDILGGIRTEARGDRNLFVIGRVASGATLEQVREQLARVASALFQRYPDNWTDVRNEARRVTVIPAKQALVPAQMRGPVTGFVAVLMAVVGAVLLIGCANIANLLLARATARQREIGVRLALGAGRGRLVRQLLTESMVLAGLGALLGVALAWAGTRALTAVRLPLPVDLRLDVTPDATVLGFAALVAIAAGLLFGLAPALLATRRSLTASIKADTATAEVAGRRLGLRGVLAGGQIMVAIVLLVVAGLLVRSLRSAQSIDPGFRTAGMLFVNLAQDENATSPEQRQLFHRELRERVVALPGVQNASYADALPLGLARSRRSFDVEGYQAGSTEDMEINSTNAGPDYLDAMGIRLLRGRDFAESDGPGGPRVAIVNEAFAARYFDGADPIGKRLGRGDALDIEIVGLARTGRYRSLGEEPLPFVWLASDQSPAGYMTLIVHGSGPLAPVGEAVRRILTEIAPDVAITNMLTADEHLAFALLPQRLGAWLLGLFGVLGLALASLGIYAVMAYSVSRRSREIGVRMALGARRADVVRMVVRQGMTVAAVGGALGLIAAGGISRLLTFLLFGVQPLDPVTFVGVAAAVGATTLLANWLPARRTAGVDPVRALRQE
jgi:predicted permease